MKITRTISDMSKAIEPVKKKQRTVGFVPTMGYLHKGHMSLVKKARNQNDMTVVSIFVNPAQFGPGEDYNKYPRDLARDEKLLNEEGVDVLFSPSVNEIYPEGYRTYVNVDQISEALCGRSRPGHFRGVTTIVMKLFNIVKPDTVYLGQKDAQQAVIIKRMAQDLDTGIAINVLPTVREKDGIAMSSRNVYLSEKERADAPVLWEALSAAKKLVDDGARDTERIKAEMRRLIITKKSARIDYVSVASLRELKELKEIEGGVLIALAVWIGKTRLIDNIVIGGKI